MLALRLFVVAAATALTVAQQCSRSKPCDTDACCSQWGNCGYGPDFCGSGCQDNCDAKPECGKWAKNFDCPLRVCCSKWGFCGTTEDFCNKECQGNCEQPPKAACSYSTKNAAKVNIGYYASWAATRKCERFTIDYIEANLYTHLNYAFVDIKNGVIAPLSPEEQQNLRNFAALKDVNPDLKVLISVGGWAFNDPGPTQQEFSDLSKTRESRKRFIQSVTQFLEEYQFDGIDIDWEYPTADDRGGRPEDKDNYLTLVKEMRSVFQSRYLITIAAPASYWYLRHFHIAKMSQHLDWINVMTYDIHGVWDADIKSLGPYVLPHTDITEIEHFIGLFVKDGVPYEKLVLGTGYYGRAYTLKDPNCSDMGCEFSGPARAGECTDAPGTLAWFEIEDYKNNKYKDNHRFIQNDTAQVRILVFDNDQWVGYDDEQTLEFKRNWARDHCMKGTMIWSIDQGLPGWRRRSEKDEVKPARGQASDNKPRLPPPQKPNLYGNRFGKPRNPATTA